MKKLATIWIAAFLILHFMAADLQASEISYIVKSGDTLWQIARENGLSTEQLKNMNNLTSDFLSIGEKLILQYNSPQPEKPPVLTPEAEVKSNQVSTYIVKQGDSLWKIADQFGISVQELQCINNLVSDQIAIGDILLITPLNQSVQPPDPEPASPSRSGTTATQDRIMEKAAQHLGTPYRYGGQAPGGFDCSGFVKYIYSQSGYDLPRTAAAQFQHGTPVEKADLVKGDLVFFCCGSKNIDHVGIFSGNNQFIHSSSPRSGGVIYSSLSEGYYARSYAGARRLVR